MRETIKEKVVDLLQKNPLLTAKPICAILNLDYNHYRNYVNNIRSEWRNSPRNERGSKCSIHGWRGSCVVPEGVNGRVRGGAVDVGWRLTESRNRWLLWKDRLGRIMWFETGRMELYVRKPASLGRAYQLVCNGLSYTGLVTDIREIEMILGSVKFRGAHYVFPTKARLPMLTIDLFRKSNGVVIKVGDRSHPNSVEVVAGEPDWGERVEDLLEGLEKSLGKLFGAGNNEVKGDPDYVS